MKGIIDNYRRLPVGKYLEIVKLCDTEMDEVDRRVKIIGILTGLTDDEVLNLPLTQFTEYCAAFRGRVLLIQSLPITGSDCCLDFQKLFKRVSFRVQGFSMLAVRLVCFRYGREIDHPPLVTVPTCFFCQ